MSDSEEEVISEVEEEVEEVEEEVEEVVEEEEDAGGLAVPEQVYERKSSAELEAEIAKKVAQVGEVKTIEVDGSHLDEADQEILQQNHEYREELASEIQEMKIRSERRKVERAEEERAAAVARANEMARRKAEEQERKAAKVREAEERKAKREALLDPMRATKNNSGPNFVIQKSAGGPKAADGEEDGEGAGPQMSKEAMDAERQQVLSQRIVALDISGFSKDKLQAKAEELFRQVKNLVGQNYDLEKRFKERSLDMQELNERARSQNQTAGSKIKRVTDDEDTIGSRFSGAPPKIMMHSQHERRLDVRSYTEKHDVFKKPLWVPSLPPRIEPAKKIVFDEDTGLPSYVEMQGGEVAA